MIRFAAMEMEPVKIRRAKLPRGQAPRLKCRITVTAGKIPGYPMREYTKFWDWIPEKVLQDSVPSEKELMKFHQNSDEAHAYARELQNPGFVNWVKLEWMWL